MTLKALFEQQGEEIVQSLRASLDANKVNASGRLRASIQAVATDDRLLITAAGYALTAEDGRGPTKNNGDGAVRRNIEIWLDQKGIQLWKGYTRQQQAYVIARKIHKEGTRLFRKGGNSGVLSSVINERLLDEIAARALREVEQTFLEGIGLEGSNGVSSI